MTALRNPHNRESLPSFASRCSRRNPHNCSSGLKNVAVSLKSPAGRAQTGSTFEYPVCRPRAVSLAARGRIPAFITPKSTDGPRTDGATCHDQANLSGPCGLHDVAPHRLRVPPQPLLRRQSQLRPAGAVLPDAGRHLVQPRPDSGTAVIATRLKSNLAPPASWSFVARAGPRSPAHPAHPGGVRQSHPLPPPR